jgi:hypothetical protein
VQAFSFKRETDTGDNNKHAYAYAGINDCLAHLRALLVQPYWYSPIGTALLVQPYWYSPIGTALLVQPYWYSPIGTALLVQAMTIV